MFARHNSCSGCYPNKEEPKTVRVITTNWNRQTKTQGHAILGGKNNKDGSQKNVEQNEKADEKMDVD